MDETRGKWGEGDTIISTGPSISASDLPQPARGRRSIKGNEGGAPHEKAKILLVDDRPANLLVYEVILAELDEELVMAHSGEEALKQVESQHFAVILLDVNMPGMDGLETAKRIRGDERFAHLPIIFMTAFADDFRIAEGYAHGAVDYMQTPVVPEVLRAKVKVFADLFHMTEELHRQRNAEAARESARSDPPHPGLVIGRRRDH